MRPLIRYSAWLWLGLALSSAPARAGDLDLAQACVVTATHFGSPEKKALAMLLDDVEKRSHIRWHCSPAPPSTGALIILGRPADSFGSLTTPPSDPNFIARPEGFQIKVTSGNGRRILWILGNDARGVLYGVGRLLRELKMAPGQITIPDQLDLATAPKYALRGHQLGYRPKTNSYDAWDVPVWEQYLRDLAIFGCNAIELIPPRSDDDADSPHFPRPPSAMMVEMSRLAAEFGMAVWVWYPAMDADYADPKTVAAALDEWSAVYEKLPRLDAVFVPGGDPGHTHPKALMTLLEKQTLRLHKYHPAAQMWVSPQGFTQPWMDLFLESLNKEAPDWLSGVVYGPQVRTGLAQLRAAVPAKYPIRHYPDITHTRQCQFPVPGWDVAYAVTEGRECINPRPEDEAAIFRSLQPHTMGFLTYSEGCNDDVNKVVWSALGWDPDIQVVDLLRDYARYFIGERYREDFAQGLLALERNWRGPLLANPGVEVTLAQFQAMEKQAAPSDLKNWRFQQALYRAYYDAYVRRRLIHETALEQRALECLRHAARDGALPAMQTAEAILDRATSEPVAADLRQRMAELAEALFQSIGMQLSVDKYRAIAVDRGASFDTADFPLNNRLWLKERFSWLRRLPGESERLNGLREIVEWENPGPGGFYDDLGAPGRQPHLVPGLDYARDPGFMESPRNGYEEDTVVDEPDEKPGVYRRVSWLDHAETLFDQPLKLRYDHLDSSSRYRLRVVYAGDSPKRKIRLFAEPGLEIHPFIVKPLPFQPLEFEIPAKAIQNGTLTLRWEREPGLGGNGRGCQVSEVWLLRK